jgi:hypothetical protein
MAIELTELMLDLIRAGAFGDLEPGDYLTTLSMSRAGVWGEPELAQHVIDLLEEQGLAAPTQDGLSIPMHPTVRATYLMLLAQLARSAGPRNGLDLHPVTNSSAAGHALASTLDLEGMPTRGRVIDFDLQSVSVNLDDVPLDEVLGFRSDHLAEHRRYMTDLRRFCRELSAMDDQVDRDRAFVDRSAELSEAAEALRSRAWKAFKKPKKAGLFSLGLLGAGMTVATGAVAPAAVGAAAAILGLIPERAEPTAYSYLFAAAREF